MKLARINSWDDFRALPVLKNSEAVYPACRKRRPFGTYQLQSGNGGVASLIAWLDHSCQKTEVGSKQGHALRRRNLLRQIPMIRKNKQSPHFPAPLKWAGGAKNFRV